VLSSGYDGNARALSVIRERSKVHYGICVEGLAGDAQPQRLSELSHQEPPNKTRAGRYHHHNDGIRVVAPGQLHGFSSRQYQNLSASTISASSVIWQLRNFLLESLQASQSSDCRDELWRAQYGTSTIRVLSLGRS
jgi:hypothetical protein